MLRLYQHVPVQAEQYDGTNNPFERLAQSIPVPFLQTPRGIIPVLIGDWVVRIYFGVYDVVKPDMFKALYTEYVPPPVVEPIDHNPIAIPIDWDGEDEDPSESGNKETRT